MTMDQLEQDKEIVEFCKKSLSYRKKLSGEEHEVCNQTFFFYNLQMFPISIKNLSFTTNANLVTLLLFALTLLESLLFYLAWQTFNTNASNFFASAIIYCSQVFVSFPPSPPFLLGLNGACHHSAYGFRVFIPKKGTTFQDLFLLVRARSDRCVIFYQNVSSQTS